MARPDGCYFDVYGWDERIEELTCANCPLYHNLCDYRDIAILDQIQESLGAVKIECQYARGDQCYVTGRECNVDPEKCHMSERDFMVLDEAEEECMLPPTEFKCHVCKETFPAGQVDLRMEWEETPDGIRGIGHYYCRACLTVNEGYR